MRVNKYWQLSFVQNLKEYKPQNKNYSYSYDKLQNKKKNK